MQIKYPWMILRALPGDMNLIPSYKAGSKRERQKIAEYNAALAELITQYDAGRLSQTEFEDQVKELTAIFLLIAYLIGAGLKDARDIPDSAKRVIGEQIGYLPASAATLRKAIDAGEYDTSQDGTPPKNLGKKILLWGGVLATIFQFGKLYLDNSKFRWDYGDTEHCDDCQRLNGQIHTGKQWRESGWYPKARHLSCNGYHCQCRFIQVPNNTPTRGNF